MAFCRAHGKRPIRLEREVAGHLVNRLQAALWREAMDAVLSGLASADDVDAAIAYGPGLRWALMGPYRLCSLAGGPRGMQGVFDHSGDALESWWRDMREVDLDAETRARLVTEAQKALAGRDVADLAAERDELLIDLLATLSLARGEGLVSAALPPAREIASGLRSPEGPVAMPDGTVLVAEIERGTLLASPAGYRGFDSLAVDADGNVCVATPMDPGITVISPDGASVEHVPMAELYTTNLCFDGPERRTTYVTLSTSGRLVAIDWPRPGFALHHLAGAIQESGRCSLAR